MIQRMRSGLFQTGKGLGALACLIMLQLRKRSALAGLTEGIDEENYAPRFSLWKPASSYSQTKKERLARLDADRTYGVLRKARRVISIDVGLIGRRDNQAMARSPAA